MISGKGKDHIAGSHALEWRNDRMDMQTANIPINTRTVGDAKNISEGIYILYLEDYVHTFIKKLIYEQEPDTIAGTSVNLYGSSFEQAAQTIMVISGATTTEQTGKNSFSTSTPLCSAIVSLNKDKGIRFEIATKGTKVILDDFYIYYDQNEEMQNYLIEWNSERRERQLRRTSAKSGSRSSVDNAARLGRLTQAYNREAAKVSLIWGAMNVLSLSLVVCVIAYGIISLNSYGKMKNMQESIDYCMTFVSENIDLPDRRVETIAPTERTPQPAKEEYTEISIDTPAATQTIEVVEEITTIESIETTPPTDIVPTPAPQPVEAANPSVPQYYVVQRGDTLRSICLNTYGDYSKMEEICELNGLDNPDSILYGQKLLLP